MSLATKNPPARETVAPNEVAPGAEMLDLSDMPASAVGIEPGTNFLAGENPYGKPPQFKAGVSPIFFDLETEPLPLAEILAFHGEYPPLEPYVEPPPFDPAAVKLGALKDPEKIKAKIEEARAKHEDDAIYSRKNHEIIYAEKKAEYEANLLKDAALHPFSSRPLAIGYLREGDLEEGPFLTIHADREDAMIRGFFDQCKEAAKYQLSIIGANIFDFDLPYLVRRAWILGIPVPAGLYEMKGRHANWNPIFVDVRLRWLCGQHFSSTKSNLDHIDRCLGGPGKGDMSGADFHRLWREDHAAAVGYLTNDLKMLVRTWERMGG
jgi:hypothetical protein